MRIQGNQDMRKDSQSFSHMRQTDNRVYVDVQGTGRRMSTCRRSCRPELTRTREGTPLQLLPRPSRSPRTRSAGEQGSARPTLLEDDIPLVLSSTKAEGCGGSIAAVQCFMQAVAATLEHDMQTICCDMEKDEATGGPGGCIAM